MRSLVAAVADLLTDPADQLLARSIFGTDDAATIAVRVAAHVDDELDTAVVGCSLFTQSVGAVFVLALADGRDVALKVHLPAEGRWRGLDAGALRAVYAAQTELANAGVRCAASLRPPAPFGSGAAAIMSVLVAQAGDDPHAESTRRALAREQARIAELGTKLAVRDQLPRVSLPATLFAPPHNALFDFTVPGGEWIDERARAARAVLDAAPEPLSVMHSDVSCANLRVVGGEVVAVYDVDSVCWIDELRCLASTAVHFTYAGDPPWTWPSRDEASAYVADYLTLRGRTLTSDERRRLDAAAIYALAYTARCELGLGSGADSSDSMRSLLAAAPAQYFT